MAWVATAAIVGTTLYQSNQAKKAQGRAERAAITDRKQARKAEVFAETKGQGQGDLGNLEIGLDDEIDDEEDDGRLSL